MEIILAIVVASAVIFFGALISMGNERQRRAIVNLQEQIALWAVQDIKIKRERLARNIRVDNPIDWLNKTAAKVYGRNLNLHLIEIFDEPRALVCGSGEGNNKMIFTPLSPSEIHPRNRKRQNSLSRFTERNPLASISRGVESYQISVLNGGIMFDLELALAWRGITNEDVEIMDHIWMYIIS
jgi:hypothetical protein